MIGQPNIRSAVKKALETRVDNGYPLGSPCDVYGLIKKLGLCLQFMDVPSLDGMFLQDDEVVRLLVCNARPSGRQRFTAGHELGHCLLGHGTQLDEIWESSKNNDSSPIEREANAFAAYLLMPPRAVQVGFRSRGLDPQRPTSQGLFRVASWLGVGYGTLLNHLHFGLQQITKAQHKELAKFQPKHIRQTAAGSSAAHSDLWMLDGMWNGQTIHMQLGDAICGANEDAGFLEIDGLQHFKAAKVGETVLTLEAGGHVNVKISKRNYIGFYDFRYLEDGENA